MILLNPNKYYYTIEPLKELTINTLFADAVVEKKIIGTVHVDNPIAPKTLRSIFSYLRNSKRKSF
jgi:hypothetical protein